MARNASARRSDGAGRGFGIFMLAVVLFLIILLLYFKDHQSPIALPRHQGVLHSGLYGFEQQQISPRMNTDDKTNLPLITQMGADKNLEINFF